MTVVEFEIRGWLAKSVFKRRDPKRFELFCCLMLFARLDFVSIPQRWLDEGSLAQFK
jgi:hypothetical protein